MIWKRARRPASIFVVGVVLAVGAAVWSRPRLPTPAQVRTRYQPSDRAVLDRSGFILGSLRSSKDVRSLDWVELDRVSNVFVESLVKAEDRRFYSHFGVDPIAAARAAVDVVRGRGRSGASTLTMQLAGLLSKEKKARKRGLKEKLFQMLDAVRLEARWSKREILEAYLNLVPFRGELIGLPATAAGFFAKSPS
ncbi:MAG: transglycosylase domain-containing protein, partial [Bdellovibrionia bacterium]